MLNRCKQVRSFLFFFSFLLTLFFLWHDKKNMAADCRLGNGCGEMGLQETQQQQHTEREFHKWNVKHQKSNSRALYFSPPFDPRNWQKLFILLSEIWRSIVKGILNGQCTHGQRNVLLCNYRGEEFVSLYILLLFSSSVARATNDCGIRDIRETRATHDIARIWIRAVWCV